MLSKIIAFEGRDGVGKTSHINRLVEFLKQHNIPHIATRELSDYEPLLSIKKILLYNDLRVEEELCLIAAARTWHWNNVIAPALAENKLVIMDRFIDSTFAYQHLIDSAHIQYVHNHLCHCRDPDVVFFIHGTPRSVSKSDKIELRDEAFFQKVEATYHARANNKWHVYSTEMAFDDIQRDIELQIMDIANHIN